jgi:regulatory protein
LAYKVNKLNLQPEEALEKLRNWCAYQERSQHEALNKLGGYGITGERAAQVISTLIEENYINEERFAMAFAGGKFRIKHWGRNRIRMELRRHKISEYSVNKALAAIDEKDYENTITLLIEKRLKQLPLADRRRKYFTTLNYAISRGFESEIIAGRLNEILGEENYEFRT